MIDVEVKTTNKQSNLEEKLWKQLNPTNLFLIFSSLLNFLNNFVVFLDKNISYRIILLFTGLGTAIYYHCRPYNYIYLSRRFVKFKISAFFFQYAGGNRGYVEDI